MSQIVTTRGLGWPTITAPTAAARLGWPDPADVGRPTDVSRETDDAPPDAEAGPVVSVESGPAPVVSRETRDAPDTAGDAGAVDDAGPGPVRPAEAPVEAAERRRPVVPAAEPLPRPRHTRVMTVANQKGGVGKTTTAVNIAAALAQAGLQVLVVDLDPQGNASTALGVEHRAGTPSIYEVIVDGVPLADVVQQSSTVPGLYCAPSTIDLAGAEIELVALVAREGRLARALAQHLRRADEEGSAAAYDYVLIDCPPSLGLLTVNALVAARELFIPIQCEYYALEGLSQLLKNVELVRTHLNPDLAVTTILLTMFDARTRLSAQVADDVRAHFPQQTLTTTIPRSVRVSEAPSFGETVMTYDPLSSGALAYLEAATQIAHRGAAQPAPAVEGAE